MTADCLPVLLADDGGTAIAIAHAGWRGLAAGVIEQTVAALAIEPSRLLAYLGPAIGPAAFEVGDEVREAFVATDAGAAAAFAPGAAGRWLADLYMLARQRLATAGNRPGFMAAILHLRRTRAFLLPPARQNHRPHGIADLARIVKPAGVTPGIIADFFTGPGHERPLLDHRRLPRGRSAQRHPGGAHRAFGPAETRSPSRSAMRSVRCSARCSSTCCPKPLSARMARPWAPSCSAAFWPFSRSRSWSCGGTATMRSAKATAAPPSSTITDAAAR